MKIVVLALLGVTAAAAAAQEVSVRTLLPQMTDLSFLTHRPSPAYKAAQASSYDRRSDPGPKSDEFANGDAGNFLRVEETSNGKEYVMADLKGPGAVVRLWSANPSGAIRFYFDGESVPRLKFKLADLLNGKVDPLGAPFGYNASSGCNLYFPFPYARSLKITADASDGGNPTSLYYHVGYRTYSADAKVKTFTWSELKTNSKLIVSTAEKLQHPESKLPIKDSHREHLESGATMTSSVAPTISSVVRELRVKIPVLAESEAKALKWEDARQTHNVLRQLILTAQFDGEKCINVPLGDFFGAAPGINPYSNYPMTVAADGTLTCRFIMPFEKSASFSIRNLGKPIDVALSLDTRPYPWGAGSYHFHAQWIADHGSTRPFREMNFLEAKGEGFFVGTNLHVASPVPDWWGEGDEKASVDGEAFPSTFGTGTEDYYGYAWGSSQLFDKPYHAQSRVDGPGSMGHTSLNRWQIFDPISYTSSLKFTLEMWHWADCIVTFAHTTYWYALPGGTPPVPVDESLLLPPRIDPPKPVEGAIEGENLKILSKTGGETEEQAGFFQLSGGKQLWWRQPKVGDKLVLEVPVAEAGSFDVIAHLGHARDYGIFKFKLNGAEIAPMDFYSADLAWKKHTLGTFDLPKGTVKFEIECTGMNPAGDPQNMFGLDYLMFHKHS